MHFMTVQQCISQLALDTAVHAGSWQMFISVVVGQCEPVNAKDEATKRAQTICIIMKWCCKQVSALSYTDDR